MERCYDPYSRIISKALFSNAVLRMFLQKTHSSLYDDLLRTVLSSCITKTPSLTLVTCWACLYKPYLAQVNCANQAYIVDMNVADISINALFLF